MAVIVSMAAPHSGSVEFADAESFYTSNGELTVTAPAKDDNWRPALAVFAPGTWVCATLEPKEAN